MIHLVTIRWCNTASPLDFKTCHDDQNWWAPPPILIYFNHWLWGEWTVGFRLCPTHGGIWLLSQWTRERKWWVCSGEVWGGNWACLCKCGGNQMDWTTTFLIYVLKFGLGASLLISAWYIPKTSLCQGYEAHLGWAHILGLSCVNCSCHFNYLNVWKCYYHGSYFFITSTVALEGWESSKKEGEISIIDFHCL